VGLLWIGVREGRKVVQVPRVATLVLLDHVPYSSPIFVKVRGLGSLFSI